MSEEKNKELVNRIAGLVKEKSQLTKQIDELTQRNDKLVGEIKILQEGISLKRKESTKSLKFKMSTVLFVDFRGFEDINHQLDSKNLIDEFDHIYIHFDEIAKKYNLVKIKTIGNTIITNSKSISF